MNTSSASPRVSVIIPSYRPGDWLEECLGSLLGQTLPASDFEVILVLNGCDHPWSDNIRAWAEAHPGFPLRFIQTDTPGVSNARNVGIDEARGEYITFIDDDDYVSPRYLEALLAEAAPGRAVLSNTLSFTDGCEGFDENYSLHRLYLSLQEAPGPFTLLQTRSFFNGAYRKLLPADLVGKRRFDPSFRNGEDSLFMFEISDAVTDIRTASPDAVYYRRFRSGSAYTRRKSLSYRLLNTARLLAAYTRRWGARPRAYNFPFYLSRLAATVKGHLLN
ncbi:MAG: glycosyltransferase family 2 protein [Muribaculaceae bacterium]|nr:glycosyltransferase family 2 protein [Muribaculaceae bacterium]